MSNGNLEVAVSFDEAALARKLSTDTLKAELAARQSSLPPMIPSYVSWVHGEYHGGRNPATCQAEVCVWLRAAQA